MKRIEVKLALPVVAPLLDVVKDLSGGLHESLAAPLGLPDLDPEFRDEWNAELLATQSSDIETLLGLFNEEFFREGVIALDEANAEPIVRACAALRLRLRASRLKALADDTLESSEVDITTLDEPVRHAFLCYLFLATLQELVIQHLDSSILDS